MSAVTGSSTDPGSEVVYVRLLGEGTTVFRPVMGVIVGPNLARLVKPADYDPEDEAWEFKPGSLVQLEDRVLGGKQVRVAVSSSG